MKRLGFWALLLVFALVWTIGSCGDDDDDDDNDDNSDDDAADDDVADDDAVDDDDNNGGPVPPYDPGDCEDFAAAWFDACHLELTLADVALTADTARASCEDFQYDFWTCALTCFDYNGAACAELYTCVNQQCAG